MYHYEPVAKRFFDGLEEGVFWGRKCSCCGAVSLPPYPACNECGSTQAEWVDMTDAEVTVHEIYKIMPTYTYGDFAAYAPIFGAECTIDSTKTEFNALIFGVTPKSYKTLVNEVPFAAKLVVMPMNGFKSMAVAINGAQPTPKRSFEVKEHTLGQALNQENGANK